MSEPRETTAKKKDPLLPVDDVARRLARDLLRQARHGALATLDSADGMPLATRTALATDMNGAPVFLTSTLSAHTQALLADARCSLLLGEPGKGDPLAHPRLTVSGSARRIAGDDPLRERLKRRYLARHPKAALYVDFADFDFWRLEVQRASLNGGFGRAYAMTPADVLTDLMGLEGLLDVEGGAVAHMNEDHADAVALYARAFCKAEDGPWQLAGLDPEGLDLVLGDKVVRLWFDTPMKSPDEMRPRLVQLAKDARAKLGIV